MHKAFILLVCGGYSIANGCAEDSCAQSIPSISIANAVARFENSDLIYFEKDDEHCEYYKSTGIFGYAMRGHHPSTAQSHYRKRFEALKKAFEQK